MTSMPIKARAWEPEYLLADRSEPRKRAAMTDSSTFRIRTDFWTAVWSVKGRNSVNFP